SSPLRSGNWRSSTRQLGAAAGGRARNSRADANTSAVHPADRNNPANASRTDTSSSTTKTIGCGSGIRCPRARSHGELKGRAGSIVWDRPEPAAVIFDDRSADRQPHAHAAALGRVESVEHLVRLFGVEADTAVGHDNPCAIAVLPVRGDHQFARAIDDAAHGFDAI